MDKCERVIKEQITDAINNYVGFIYSDEFKLLPVGKQITITRDFSILEGVKERLTSS